MKKLIIIIYIFIIGTNVWSQQNNLVDGDCNSIDNFESNILNSAENWQNIKIENWGVVSRAGNNVMSTDDLGGASFIYNKVDFPSNLVKAGCELRYLVKFEDGLSNENNANNSIWIFNGTSPENCTFAAKFELNDNRKINAGNNTFYEIRVPLSEAGNVLPFNSFGSWKIVDLSVGAQNYGHASITTSPTAGQLAAFNNAMTNCSGIALFLDVKGISDNPEEKWEFDNFCIVPCPTAVEIVCCKTDLEIFNKPGTPNPLNTEQVTNNGATMTVASEEFQINRDATIPITELRAVVTDIQYKYNYESCGECINNPASWGSIYSTSTIGEKGLYPTSQDYGLNNPNFVDQNATVRETIWSNPNGAILRRGDKFTVNYILPTGSDIPCCVAEVKICTKISWKDANCNVCEINTCSNIKLENGTAGDGNTSNCECGRQIGTGITVNPKNGNFTPNIVNPIGGVKCGSTVRLSLYRNQWFSKKTHEFIAPSYSCLSNDCSKSYKWEIFNSSGQIYKQGIGSRINTWFPSRGEYRVRFTPICGGKECAPCEINTTIY